MSFLLGDYLIKNPFTKTFESTLGSKFDTIEIEPFKKFHRPFALEPVDRRYITRTVKNVRIET